MMYRTDTGIVSSVLIMESFGQEQGLGAAHNVSSHLPQQQLGFCPWPESLVVEDKTEAYFRGM